MESFLQMLDCLEGSCREKEGRRVERLGLISCGTVFIDWESADGARMPTRKTGLLCGRNDFRSLQKRLEIVVFQQKTLDKLSIYKNSSA